MPPPRPKPTRPIVPAELSAIILSTTITALPGAVTIPPPRVPAVFFETVLDVIVIAAEPCVRIPPPSVAALFSVMVLSRIVTAPEARIPPPEPAAFPEIVLAVTIRSPNARMAPPWPPMLSTRMEKLSAITLEVSVRFSMARIAPPSPLTSPPVSVSPWMVTLMAPLWTSSMFITRLPSPSLAEVASSGREFGVGSLPLASIESRLAPGPLIMSGLLMTSWPSVSVMVAGPPLVNAA